MTFLMFKFGHLLPNSIAIINLFVYGRLNSRLHYLVWMVARTDDLRCFSGYKMPKTRSNQRFRRVFEIHMEGKTNSRAIQILRD